MIHFCADELVILVHLLSWCQHCRDYAVELWRAHQLKVFK